MADEPERWQLSGKAPEVYERELVPAIFEVFAPLVVAAAELLPGERVLDVACGTGVVARACAEVVGETGFVAGVDLNPGMLERARAGRPVAGHAAIEWRQEDAVALPFAQHAFDAVVCQAGLQYISDRHQATSEMRRVLAPGGRVVVLVWRSIVHSPGWSALADALGRHVSAEAAAIMHAPFVFGDSTDELRQLLTGAGFGPVSIEAHTRTVRFSSPAAFVKHQVSASPLALHVASVDDTARAALIDDVTSATHSLVDEHGLAFPVHAHIASARLSADPPTN